MLSIKLIINPAARRINNYLININKLTKKLNKKNIIPEIIYTTKNKSDESLIMKDFASKDAVMVCGGDGTLNKVITYMIKYNIYKPISFLPSGTANVFALEKKLSFSVDTTIDTLLNGRKVFTDIGIVEHDKGTSYFLLMVGVGLDAKAINEANVNTKKILGKATYLFSGVKNLITYNPRQIEVRYGDSVLNHIHTVILSNSRLYGGKVSLFPFASMHDGLLDICAFKPENNVALLKHLVTVHTGRHIKSDDVLYSKAKEAYLKSENSKKVPFQIDGEFAGYLPIKVRILDHKIQFMMPSSMNAASK